MNEVFLGIVHYCIWWRWWPSPQGRPWRTVLCATRVMPSSTMRQACQAWRKKLQQGSRLAHRRTSPQVWDMLPFVSALPRNREKADLFSKNPRFHLFSINGKYWGALPILSIASPFFMWNFQSPKFTQRQNSCCFFFFSLTTSVRYS